MQRLPRRPEWAEHLQRPALGLRAYPPRPAPGPPPPPPCRCSVRVWRRSDWTCSALHRYGDFVWSVVERGGRLLVSAGAEVHVHDAATGKLARK